MNSKKNLTIIVFAVIVIGVLAFQFLNHTGHLKTIVNILHLIQHRQNLKEKKKSTLIGL